MYLFNILLTSNINAVMNIQKKFNNFINIQPPLYFQQNPLKLCLLMEYEN